MYPMAPFDETGPFYLNYESKEASSLGPHHTLHLTSKELFGIGIAIYFMDMEMGDNWTQLFAFVINMGFHLCKLVNNQNIQYGIDYTAYIN